MCSKLVATTIQPLANQIQITLIPQIQPKIQPLQTQIKQSQTIQPPLLNLK